MTIPTTDAVRATVIIGFKAVAEPFAKALGMESQMVSDEEISRDFDQWLNQERGLAYQQALEDIQEAINEAAPIIPGETTLDIVNPYYDKAYGTTDGA